jgi:hypothetical protein
MVIAFDLLAAADGLQACLGKEAERGPRDSRQSRQDLSQAMAALSASVAADEVTPGEAAEF